MPWPRYSGLSSRLVLRLRGSGGGKAGGDVVAGEGWFVGGWWCSSKRLLELLLPALPRAWTLPVCSRGVIGPILSGQRPGGRNKGP